MALKKHLQIRRWNNPTNKSGVPDEHLLYGEPFWNKKESRLYIGDGTNTPKYVGQDDRATIDANLRSIQATLDATRRALRGIKPVGSQSIATENGIYKPTEGQTETEWTLNGNNMILAINRTQSQSSESNTKLSAHLINADNCLPIDDPKKNEYQSDPPTLFDYLRQPWSTALRRKSGTTTEYFNVDDLLNYENFTNTPVIGTLNIRGSKQPSTTINVTITASAPNATNSSGAKDGDIWIQYVE